MQLWGLLATDWLLVMTRFLTTRAIILRRINYGEADRILTMLTSDFGKIRLIAKGVRKQKSRMAGGLELFGVSEINFIKGRGGMGTLTSARIEKYFANIVKDLDRTNVAYGLLKQSDEVIEDDMGSEYFDVLFDGLYALDFTKLEAELCRRGFDLRLMQMLGDLPDFAIGADGNKLDASLSFDFDAERLAFVPREDGAFNVNHIKLIKLLAHNPTHKIMSVQGFGDYGRDIYKLVSAVSAVHRA